MKRKFSLLLAAIALLTMMASTGTVLGQSDFSATYTSSVTLPSSGTNVSSCTIVIGGTSYDGTKLGKSGAGASASITVPAGTKYIHLHVAAWKAKSPSFTYAVGSGTAQEISGITSNDGISNNPPFNFSGDASSSDYYKVITLSSALTEATSITFASTGERVVFWGVNTEEESSGTTHELTYALYPEEAGTLTIGNFTANPATMNEGATINITAEANVGYVFSAWNLNWGDEATIADPTSASTTFTMGTSDASILAVFTTVNTYTVTYNPNVTGITAIQETYNDGATVVIASNTFSNPGYHFTGWNTDEGGNGVEYAPGDEFEIHTNLELYAQWEENSGSEITDVLDTDFIGNPSTYTTWEGKTGASGAEYAGQSTGGTNYIQIRATSPSGIVTTASGGLVTKVAVTWNSMTYDGRTLNVYGSNSPYSSSADLYGADPGTLIGTIVYGTSTELNITDNYEFIGLRSAGSAMYLDKIEITWSTGGTPAPSFTIENNNEVAYDATSGSFTFTINNPVEGGTLGISEEVDWISEAAIEAMPGGYLVTYNTTTNDNAASRQGVITLTYNYGDAVVAKNVTVTQAGNPDAVMTIAEVRAQGTGSVVTKGIVTSCVGTTGYIQDATAAICVYGTALTVGDEIKVSGTLSSYKGLLEITSPQVNVLSQGNVVLPQLMTIEEVVASTNQGWYIRIEDATVTNIDGQNTTIAQGDASIVVRGITGVEFAVNDVISLNGNIGCYNTVQIANPTDVVVYSEPSITAEPSTLEFEYMLDLSDEIKPVVVTSNDLEAPISISFEEPCEFSLSTDGETWGTEAEIDGNGTLYVQFNEGLSVGSYSGTIWLISGNTNTSVTLSGNVIAPSASIVVEPSELSVDYGEHEGTFDVAYSYVDPLSATIVWQDATGAPVEEYDWILAEIDSDNNVEYYIGPNEGEERTAYFQILADNTYSNTVTITQGAYVVDYATLPFEWEGGIKSDLLALTGVSAQGLGSDYAVSNAPYRVKFDTDGDYILIKTDQQPGVVTVGIKKVGGANASSITIKGSSNGSDFSEIQTFDNEGAANAILTHITTVPFYENDRYVMIYFNKPDGGSNVGVGPITITPVDYTPSITLEEYEINVDCAEHSGSIMVTYNNVDPESATIVWQDVTGAPVEGYDWILAEIDSDNNVEYYIDSNEDEDRTAYFQILADNTYSNTVTITQAAPLPPVEGIHYALVTSADELIPGKHYLIASELFDGEAYIMHNQTNNNRAALQPAIAVSNNVIVINPLEIEEYYDFVISGDENHQWTIFDEKYNEEEGGYLYAASSGSNYLRTRSDNEDGNSVWNISFDDEAGYANIVAQGTFSRNTMQYNSGSHLFACYGSASQKPVYLYKKVDEQEVVYYSPTNVYIAELNADQTPTTVLENEILTVGTLTSTDENNLIIENGAELIHNNNNVKATLKKDIAAAPWRSVPGWYTISSPVADAPVTLATTGVEGDYDFYAYDEPTAYWLNQKLPENNITNFIETVGYLYASQNARTLEFQGTMKATSTNIETEDLSYACTYAGVKGFNLLGNPFSCSISDNITIGGEPLVIYYTSDGGEELDVCNIEESPIKPAMGFMVQATAEGQNVVFNAAKGNRDSHNGYIRIMAGNEARMDKAYITVGNGNTLRKMTITNDNAKVYVVDNDNDYAAARINTLEGSMPVCFDAVTTGTYSINVEARNLDADYLHLVDRLTGADVDLLLDPTYVFEASGNDDANRFFLVFSLNGNTEINGNTDNFAYQSGDDLIVNGNGELQVFDVMGRFVMNCNINGNERISTSAMTNGVYVLRFVGETVKTQKIVLR